MTRLTEPYEMLATYNGLANERLSLAVAGGAGTLIVLAVGSGVFLATRRGHGRAPA